MFIWENVTVLFPLNENINFFVLFEQILIWGKNVSLETSCIGVIFVGIIALALREYIWICCSLIIENIAILTMSAFYRVIFFSDFFRFFLSVGTSSIRSLLRGLRSEIRGTLGAIFARTSIAENLGVAFVPWETLYCLFLFEIFWRALIVLNLTVLFVEYLGTEYLLFRFWKWVRESWTTFLNWMGSWWECLVERNRFLDSFLVFGFFVLNILLEWSRIWEWIRQILSLFLRASLSFSKYSCTIRFMTTKHHSSLD